MPTLKFTETELTTLREIDAEARQQFELGEL